MIIAAVSATAVLLAAQTPAGKIDFGRDVQPILQQHSCELSRPRTANERAAARSPRDALRGGTQSDIGPGNADGSRLYHRLIDTKFGQRMPPAGPLKDAEIETIKEWIDQGVEWPDELSGEVPTPAADPDAAVLMSAIRQGDQPAIDRVLRDTPQAVRHRGPDAATPLMSAALYGDAALVKRLLALGADPDARDTAGATALMWAAPDRGKMQLLLDAGADVNARSDAGRSALVVVGGIVGAADALKLLLDYGADPSPWTASEPSPLREAARVNDSEMFRLLFERAGRPAGGGLPAAFVRTNCAACAALVGAGGPLPRRPPPPMPGPVQRNYDPSGPRADGGRRDDGDARGDSRGDRPQPAAPAGDRRRVHQAHRLCLVSSQQPGRNGRCHRARQRLRGERDDGEDAAACRRRLSRFVESAHAAEPFHCWRTGHDQLSPVGPRRRELSTRRRD
jgi:hypothetical protein